MPFPALAAVLIASQNSAVLVPQTALPPLISRLSPQANRRAGAEPPTPFPCLPLFSGFRGEKRSDAASQFRRRVESSWTAMDCNGEGR